MNDFKVKRSTIPRYPMIKPVLFGFVGGTLACFAVLFIAAFLMTLKDVPEWSIGVISVVASAVGAFFGGFICAYMLKKRGLLFGALVGLIIFAMIFIIGCICGASPFTLGKLATLISDAVFGAIGGIVGINKVIKRKF